MKLKLSGIGIKGLSRKKRNLLIVSTLLFIIFSISGGYLLWRVSQPEPMIPEDVDAAPLEIKEVDGYKIYIFGQSGTFTLDQKSEVEYLIIGGGGGGGAHRGGGGGAGGFLTGKTTIEKGSYPVTVGSGGAGGTRNPWQEPSSRGNNGGNSSVFDIVATGGGGGGSSHNIQSIGEGKSGGSGGGSGGYRYGRVGDSFNAGLGTSGQGNSGGKGSTAYDPHRPSSGALGHGGGGGGAGGAGGRARDIGELGYVGGFGGHGKSSNITGSVVWYAGGGGGASFASGHAPGGNGGGNPVNRPSGKDDPAGGGGGHCGWPAYVPPSGCFPLNGVNGTGGGGAGGTKNTNGYRGGSGIVVIRYKEAEKFVVTYDGNGGICEPGSRTVSSGEDSAAPTCTREGYTLVGFTRTAGSGGNLNTQTGAVTNVTGNQTITANWEALPDSDCGNRAGVYPYTTTDWPEDKTQWCEVGDASEFNPNQQFPVPGQSISWVCVSGTTTVDCSARTEVIPEEEPEEEPEEIIVPAAPTVPETGIFDDTKTAVIVGLSLLFLGFTWRILGRGMYIYIGVLGRIHKKISIHTKDVKEDIRAKRRINLLKKKEKNRKKFEKKVVKD